MHWEAYFLVEDLWEEMGRVNENSPDALLNAALERLPRAEHGLLSKFITELASGKYSFAEAKAIWEESENDTMYITWREPDELLRFLRYVRDRIEPHACPASLLRFRPD
jgi:hypothetical protein